MAYDEELAERIRALVAGEPALTEKKMFGGLAFLVGGNMAVAASGEGGLLVRVDPAESEGLVARSTARPMVMRGREMRVAAGRLRRRSHRARAGEMGRARHGVRPLAAAEVATTSSRGAS